MKPPSEMLRIHSILLAALWLLSGMLGAEPEATETSEATALRRLAKLEAEASQADAREIRFIERRRFPFRSRPVELEAIARVDSERGASIEYPSKSEMIIVDAEGVLIRRLSSDGIRSERALPRGEGAVGHLITRLLSLDTERLKEDFSLETEGDEELWTVTMRPIPGELERIEEIRVQSDSRSALSILIQMQGRRFLEITPLEERTVEGFTQDALRRYFR